MFDEATELPETLKSLVVSTDNKSFEDTTAASILGNRTCLNKHIVHKASLLFILVYLSCICMFLKRSLTIGTW